MSPPPTAPPIGSGRVVFARGAPSAAASTARARLDLRDQTGVRIEELLVRLRPAAEGVDREQLRPRRDVEVRLLPVVLREERLVLVGEQRVALAVQERVQRVACRLVLHRNVAEQLVEVLRRLLLRLSELE